MSKGLADLQRRLEAGDPEAIESVQRMFAAFSKAMTNWLESIRPAVKQITEIMNRPEIRAYLERAAEEEAS